MYAQSSPPTPPTAAATDAQAKATAPSKRPNRLAASSSPYLLQHAHNPVDWYPWGPEAFAAARERQVPIFLSVGYSTCYWCHVMERESFENDRIAAIMNEHFVCVKVDREERPDVDDIYMAAVQLITRRGGWPMSVWLTPPGARGPDDRGLQPFYAGTYFPAESRGGMSPFPDVLRALTEAWTNDRDQVLGQAQRVTGAIAEQLAKSQDPTPVGRVQVLNAIQALLRTYDRENAGFGRAPKFPQPVYLDYLLHVVPALDDPAVGSVARRAIRHTLDRMAIGGMYDQVGGGFHRYSVDEKWLVPHFEKMLYDNGQLASLYARSFKQSRDPFDAEILRQTLDYTLREMTDPAGGFYSAQDAEVNHREGQNYLWSAEQLRAVLNEDDARFITRVYGLADGPNFRDPHHPNDPAANVLFLSDRPEKVGAAMEMDPRDFRTRLDRVNQLLYTARMRRDQPRLDDKVIVGWNGLMIAAMAEAGAVLNEQKYLDAAQAASAFILGSMRDHNGHLLRVWRNGKAGTPAFLEDYAMLAKGLLAIHRARIALKLEPLDHLKSATRLVRIADELFGERVGPHPGVMYDTLPEQGDLIVRSFSTYDGAIPAGTSVMAHNLLDLFELTKDRTWLVRCATLLGSLSHAIKQAPVATINSTQALDRLMRLDPDLAASIGAQSGAQEEEAVVVRDTPVQIFAAAERVLVTKAEPAVLPLELRIQKGFHVTAHDSGIEGLFPFDIRIEGGAGVRAVVDYPEGSPYEGQAVPPEDRGRMRVYEDVVRFEIRLERTDEPWSGLPLIIITYQPCTDVACFQPMTVELDVALDPG